MPEHVVERALVCLVFMSLSLTIVSLTNNARIRDLEDSATAHDRAAADLFMDMNNALRQLEQDTESLVAPQIALKVSRDGLGGFTISVVPPSTNTQER